jgi:hypothetical protein
MMCIKHNAAPERRYGNGVQKFVVKPVDLDLVQKKLGHISTYAIMFKAIHGVYHVECKYIILLITESFPAHKCTDRSNFC